MEKYFSLLFFIFCILGSGHQINAEDDCLSNPCKNGATCVDDGNYGYYTCQCTTNWMGKNCEIAVEGANCGTNYYSSTANISSPNYPNNYNNNDHCLYLIRVHGATRINLSFKSIATANWDRLLIGTGPTPSSTSVRHGIHNYESLDSIDFITSEIWMEFVSNYEDTSSGWSCTYTADFDGCLCFNEGICSNEETKQCSCPAGFEGERYINECASMPCLNGGTCIDRTNSYTCQCDHPWQSTHCEINYSSPCDSMPCLNRGFCLVRDGRYSCSCNIGWRGVNCELEIEKCLSNECFNGGTCFVYINRNFCTCPAGYVGALCDSDDDECFINPCLNGGTCNDGLDFYTCDCLQGWTGVNCAEIDDCESSPCQNGGTCYDLSNQYLCLCLPGWHGDACNVEDFQDDSGDNDVTVYLVTTIVLAVILVLMIIAFIIFYKFCYLKKTENGHNMKNPVAQYAVPKEMVPMTTADTFEDKPVST